MDFQQGFDRNQLLMIDFDSMVASDSWARIVDLFVAILPMEELGFNNILQKQGRPRFKVRDLFAFRSNTSRLASLIITIL